VQIFCDVVIYLIRNYQKLDSRSMKMPGRRIIGYDEIRNFNGANRWLLRLV